MSDIEAVGDAATGAIIGRAIEPGQGESDGHTHETSCLNCGTPLIGPFCAQCGQHAHVHRTLTALWHDIAHGVFHFEGKVWRTLPMLAWRPGEVTRRYIHGERARFVSPLALFLFAVFLMFAVFEGVGGPIAMTGNAQGPGNLRAGAQQLDAETVATRDKISRLEQERQAAITARKPHAQIDAAIAEARDDLRGLTATRAILGGEDGALSKNATIDTGSKEFDDRIRHAFENPKLLLYKMQTSAYKFAWALIPISLPFMWAMFAWRREYHIYDHAVFVTYSLSFVVLLLVAMALIAALGGPSGWLLLLVPVHFYRQLKQAYQLSTGGALWRTVALGAVATITLLTFAGLLLTLGLSE